MSTNIGKNQEIVISSKNPQISHIPIPQRAILFPILSLLWTLFMNTPMVIVSLIIFAKLLILFEYFVVATDDISYKKLD